MSGMEREGNQNLGNVANKYSKVTTLEELKERENWHKDLYLYDFSNEKAGDEYVDINCSIDKYFAYIISSCKLDDDDIKILNIDENTFNVYKNIIDPDSNSILLREIYKILWGFSSDYCTCCYSPKIQGDTMNSASTTINKYCNAKSKKEMLINYTNDNQYYGKKLEGTVSFLEKYHCLGNFMPIPYGCNVYGGVYDYWDLKLLSIYNYYRLVESNAEEAQKYILNIVSIKKLDLYCEWLNYFKTWDNFVETNFLGDNEFGVSFVQCIEKNNEGRKYGEPRELWSKHFVDYKETKIALPQKEDNCKEFFDNVSNWITNRGKLMVKVLKDKLDKQNKPNINNVAIANK